MRAVSQLAIFIVRVGVCVCDSLFMTDNWHAIIQKKKIQKKASGKEKIKANGTKISQLPTVNGAVLRANANDRSQSNGGTTVRRHPLQSYEHQKEKKQQITNFFHMQLYAFVTFLLFIAVIFYLICFNSLLLLLCFCSCCKWTARDVWNVIAWQLIVWQHLLVVLLL